MNSPWAKAAPAVDISALMRGPTPEAAEPLEYSIPKREHEQPVTRCTFPPGLVGQVAEYIFFSSVRPIKEVALSAAIALCAGVCGRSYNISGTGLNQYIILLAKTGRGKEGAATGIDNLMAAVRQTIPMADQFIGPAAFASGQALVKFMDTRPCFVSVLGEFGLTLQQICDPKAASPLVMLRKVLLDIYSKSGHSKVLRSSVYSDSEKNTRIIQAPNVTLLGESTPETFFNGLDASHIAEGLIPRFTIIEYDGPRPQRNPTPFEPPSPGLVAAFVELVTTAINTAQNHTCSPVATQTDALALFDELNDDADFKINHSALETEAELWNRAHLKALKLAALVAVGCNIHAPMITLDIAKWSCALIRREIGDILKRFQAGEIGNGAEKQEMEIRRLFAHFQTLSESQRKTHRCPDGLMRAQVCPLSFLTIYTRRLACFKYDQRGPIKALGECLADMMKREVLEALPLLQLQNEYGMKTPIYYQGKGW